MRETLELFTEQKRSTDSGIQIKLELSVPKNSALSYKYHQMKAGNDCLPKISLGITTKDRTSCEPKDHGTHGHIYVARYVGWQFIVEFPHHVVIRVFIRGMVCLIEHK